MQQGVREDGLSASECGRTARQDGMTRVRCHRTGRTHQIRVHLEHLGHFAGRRLMAFRLKSFCTLKHGTDAWTRDQTGAPPHALHCAEMSFPHPKGERVTASAAVPEDMERWWAQPSCLPHDPSKDTTPLWGASHAHGARWNKCGP